MSSDTLTNLQIVSPTVEAASKETRRKYQYALDMGVLQCPTAKVMFLGDKGVGKSSTKDLLLGKDFAPEETENPLIRNYVTETKTQDSDWSEVTEDSLAAYENSEFLRAIAYFCAFQPVNYIQTTKDKVLKAVSNIGIFLSIILILSFSASWYLADNKLYYSELLVACCLVLGLATKDFINGCTIGHGLAVVIIFAKFFITNSPQYFLSYSDASRLVAVGIVGAACGYSFGGLLALGIGAGLSCSLSVLRNDQPNSASVISMSLFALSMLVAVLLESKPVQNLHRLVSVAVIPLAYILSVLLFHKAMDDWGFLSHYIAGFFFGLSFIAGQKHGRKVAWRLNLGHTNRILTDLIGAFLGFLFGYFVLQWDVPEGDRHLAIGIVGVVFSVSGELYRYYWMITDRLPAHLISKMKRDNDKDWPAKLHLLDCKSTEVYDNAHHIFMSRYCNYLILFRLDQLRDDFEATYDRLLFWLNSVFSHARHEDAKVFLVATHKCAIRDEERRNRLLERLHEKMYHPFGHRLAWNAHKDSLVFAVENVLREFNDEDVVTLKRIVFETAMKAEYTTKPNRVTWFEFLDIIRKRKQAIRSDPKAAIIKCNTLWKEVKDRCHLNVQSDFYRMLKYFHDSGEIYFDESDPILCRLVVFDPQFLVDAVHCLLTHKNFVQGHSRMKMLREDYTKHGVIALSTLKSCLRPFMDEDDNIIRLLVSLNVLLPVDGRVHPSVFDRYVVPFLLPDSQTCDKKMRTPDYIVAFDFGCFHPQAVFLVLLSKCLSLSFRTTEEYGLVVTEKNLRFYRDMGSFYFADAIHLSLHLGKRKSENNFIWVRLKALESAHHQGDIYDLLQQLDVLMRRICWRYFEFLEYKYKVLCDCCLDKCADMNDPPDEAELDWHTVVDHATNAPLNLSRFPSRDQSYICREQRTFRFKGNPKEIDEKEYEKDPDLLRNVVENYTHDAFISCDSEDRIFVFYDLLPILENASTESFGDGPRRDNLSLVVNEYDNASPDYRSEQSPFVTNMMKMQASHCVIAVISRSYNMSLRCKRELELAKKMEKTIIPVVIDPQASIPLPAGGTNTIEYPDDKSRLREDFYEKIIRSVKHVSGRTRAPKYNLLQHLLHGLKLRRLPPPDLDLG